MLQETDKDRRRRIRNRFLGSLAGILFTCVILALDAYVLFTPGLLKAVTNHPDHDKVSISFGPLLTELCTSADMNESAGNYTVVHEYSCTTLLFYQVPIDDYIGPVSWSSTNIMIAYWVPLIFALLSIRATLLVVHPYLQMLVSLGHIGTIYLIYDVCMNSKIAHTEYTYEYGIIVLFARMCFTIVMAMVTTSVVLARLLMIKYDIFGCGNDEPVLVGIGYNVDKDDITGQKFWSAKSTKLHISRNDETSNCIPIKRHGSYQSIDLGNSSPPVLTFGSYSSSTGGM